MAPDPPTGPLSDRQAQFLIAVGDLCSLASLAELRVEVESVDGTHVAGVPRSVRHAGGEDEVDDSGYARTFRIDDRLLALDEVTVCTVRAPQSSPSS